MKQFAILLLSVLLSANFMLAQEITGKWKTIDDETGKAKSIVEIYKKNGKLYGKIVKLINPKEENPKCTKCTDYRKNKPIIGMNIITGLTEDDGEWEGDDAILDPESGKLYDCKLWIDKDAPNKLNVRGYIGFFFRTQTWYRVK